MFRNEDKGERPNKRLLPPFVQYIEWLWLSCLSILLFISGDIVPIIGIALALTSPVPISLIGIRQGTYKAFLAVAFVSATLFLLFEGAGSVSFILGAGFLGIAFGAAVKKTNSAGEAILGLIIASVISKLMFMGFMVYTRGHNPFAFDESSVNALISSLNSSGVSEDILKTVMRQISLLTPSLLTMAAGLDAFINYLLVSKIESKRQNRGALPINVNSADEETNEITKIHPVPAFEQWSFPRSLLAAFFTAFLITLFDASSSSGVLYSAELNLKILTSVMFFIQGLSFVWWFMLFKNFSYWVSLSFLFILPLMPVFSMGLIIAGIADITIDLREKIRRVNK